MTGNATSMEQPNQTKPIYLFLSNRLDSNITQNNYKHALLF
jgi:hypothetical protein